MNINKNYRFDNFKINKDNRFAFNLASIVAKQPGKKYIPLFISGNKKDRTHLMNAVANYVIEVFNYNVLYVNATEINSIASNVDLLLIDELECLSIKDEIKLIEIIKAFQSNKKQVVLGSDETLDELNVSDKLKTVINWGISVNIKQ